MKRLLVLSALAIGLLPEATPQSNHAHGSVVSSLIGRGGYYNGYGQGYYGGYGQGYNGYGQSYGYGPRIQTYSTYGNGPYGYGSGSAYQFQSNGGYGYDNGTYYNGYSSPGYYGQPYVPVYGPYGYGVYNSYGNRW